MTGDKTLRPEWREQMLEELASSDLARSTQALLSLTYNDPDRVWLEDLLLRELDEAKDPQLRSLAITCMGHVGRLHGSIGKRIIDRLEVLLDDPQMGGLAEDALGDLRYFAKVV